MGAWARLSQISCSERGEKASANSASAAQLQAAFEAAGVPNASSRILASLGLP
ncbi:MAG TPA: hypothetical protein VGR85_13015 [Candidatus Limnocylindria bacterium]|nr:hypothetical protein [Candidatus Limnocylindria bacterium]